MRCRGPGQDAPWRRCSTWASASINTGQQLGGSIGTALLNTIAASAATGYLADHLPGGLTPEVAELAAVHSYMTVFWWCAGLFAAGAVVCGGLLRRGPLTRPATIPARELAAVHSRRTTGPAGGPVVAHRMRERTPPDGAASR